MLSPEQCRKILGPSCNISDSDLELLREQLYGLADISISSFLGKGRDRGVEAPFKADIKPPAQLTDTERAKLEERAAIMEFEAGLPRSEAESQAFEYLREDRRKPR